MALTAKQQLFVKEYLIDLNASAAYKRAGYKSKNPDVDGHKLLVTPSIQEAVKKAMDKRSQRTEITADMVLQEYAKLAFSNITDYLSVEDKLVTTRFDENGQPITELQQVVNIFDTDMVKEDKMRAVAEIKQTREGIALKLHDKKGALDSIARHLGMFNDKIEVKGEMTHNVNHDLKKLSPEELKNLEHILEKSADTGTGQTS